MQIPAEGDAAVEFGCKFQLGARPRWNLRSNYSKGRSRNGIWMKIPAGGEAEVEFKSKFQLWALPRWNLNPNSSWGRRTGEI